MNIESFGSVCSGVGMQEMAYKKVFNTNIKYFSEIDKFSIKSYIEIHGNIPNLGDFTKANEIEEVDFMFASTPCQDFSLAGERKGFEGLKGTLTFEWVNMLKKLKTKKKLPKVICFENVPGIISKDFINKFYVFKNELRKLGYIIHQGQLNAKDFELPQNRNRIFLVGFLENMLFKFPNPVPLKKRLKDILEKKVDETFYLDSSLTKKFILDNLKTNENIQVIGTTANPEAKGTNSRSWIYSSEGIMGALSATDYKQPKQILEPKVELLGMVDNKEIEQNKRVYSLEGISPTLLTRPNKVLVKEGNKKGYTVATEGDSINLERLGSKSRRGRVGKQISQTLTTSCNQAVINQMKIRKLTPLECWRLMGISAQDFYKAQSVNSNAQLYKQAGNGIAVNVLVAIFEEIKKATPIDEKFKLVNNDVQYCLF